MKFTIELTAEENPDAVGELLRSKFFKSEAGEIGCYSVFEWQNDVKPLPPIPISEHNHAPGDPPTDDFCEACACGDGTYTRGFKEGIECRWFWDGDGLLAFKIPGSEEWLFNSDCKKDHGWELEKELW